MFAALGTEQRPACMFYNGCEHCCQGIQFSLLHSSSCFSTEWLFLPELPPWPVDNIFFGLLLFQRLTWWSLTNFSKFPAIIGIGRDNTRTPATAHILPNSFPSPKMKEYKLFVILNHSYQMQARYLHIQLWSWWPQPSKNQWGWRWTQSHCQPLWNMWSLQIKSH